MILLVQKIKHFERSRVSLKEVTYNRQKNSIERDVYSYIGDTSINEFTKAKILELIYTHELKGHHEVAHRLHDILEAIFEFAVGASLTENYPFISLK